MTVEHQQLIQRIRASAEAIAQATAAIPAAGSSPDFRTAVRATGSRAPAAKQTVAPKPGDWSVKQILLHTRDVVMLAYGLRIRRLLFETDPVFASYEEDAYRALNPGDAESVEGIVQMIAEEHDLIARLLSTLPAAAWERSGRHPESGSHTIAFFATRTAEHAEEHAAQIGALQSAL
jgi:DinB superfamily